MFADARQIQEDLCTQHIYLPVEQYNFVVEAQSNRLLRPYVSSISNLLNHLNLDSGTDLCFLFTKLIQTQSLFRF